MKCWFKKKLEEDSGDGDLSPGPEQVNPPGNIGHNNSEQVLALVLKHFIYTLMCLLHAWNI